MAYLVACVKSIEIEFGMKAAAVSQFAYLLTIAGVFFGTSAIVVIE